MEKQTARASVRLVVEYALMGGSLAPGMQLSRMRDGMYGHVARQKQLPDARTEVSVRGAADGAHVHLEISGRIDALYARGGVPVVEEIKLTPARGAPAEAEPVHRAQAECYGHMLDVPRAIIRVLYVEKDGAEVAAFEQEMDRAALSAAFLRYVTPYLARLDAQAAWRDTRDRSIARLAFPYGAYRAGQRELSVHTFWAVKTRRRLFAQAPTGTGKTAAVLFPAIKALGKGLTGQLFYLTARTTAQQNAEDAAERMRAKGLCLRSLVMTAKEKSCPYAQRAADAEAGAQTGARPPAWRCDMLTCPYADGFFDRLPGALAAMRAYDAWSRSAVSAVAAAHEICPHEFALALCEEADLIIGDYNYAFDPGARIRRIFQRSRPDVSLLVDEAHNLPDRARDMLSAVLDSRQLREVRRQAGKRLGRKSALYLALGALIARVEGVEDGAQEAPPEDLRALLDACMEAALLAAGEMTPGDLTRVLLAALGSLERFDGRYAALTETIGRAKRLSLLCLDAAPYLSECTKPLRGTVYFSATLTPVAGFRESIGAGEDDAALSLPSPFPQEHFLVLRVPITTVYAKRAQTAGAVAQAILAMVRARPGNYLACFPSYAYLNLVAVEIAARDADTQLHIQQGGMDDAARAAYLERFAPRETGAMLGMVVLGGVFGEGVDLPGERLSGVAVVGVGLPQLCPERDLLRAYYDASAGHGFQQAYQYPGMNKVLQAVGRVIRTEEDRGVALLIDNRFLGGDYEEMMPPWWGGVPVMDDAEAIAARLAAFWREM